jgi:UDP-N-acetylmuramoyl-tripeptide--D-alanyl-D-alanine ligase
MISMRLSEAADLLGGRLIGEDRQFKGVSTDTRELNQGELFFALKGPRFDAHDLLDDARKKSAIAAVSSKLGDGRLPIIKVLDSRAGLVDLAQNWRGRFELPVVGITGSAGKTSVKEMLGSILEQNKKPLVTLGNLNNDIGVPLTLFRLDSSHNCAAIEMGASNPKDIEKLCAIARPKVGVITLCAPSHLDGFGDVRTVARTKGEIITNLPEDGVAVINNEDLFRDLWIEMAGNRQVVRFGRGGDLYASDVSVIPGKINFKMNIFGSIVEIELSRRGTHHINNALAASGAAYALGIDLKTIARGLEKAPEAKGRLNFLRQKNGLNILNDTYNANPVSTHAAIDALAIEKGVCWMVFGDMGELGANSPAFHAEVGEYAATALVDRLYTVGRVSRHAADSFGVSARHFETQASLIESLVEDVENSEKPLTILLKASRSMSLELVTDALCTYGSTEC